MRRHNSAWLRLLSEGLQRGGTVSALPLLVIEATAVPQRAAVTHRPAASPWTQPSLFSAAQQLHSGVLPSDQRSLRPEEP